MMHTRVLHPSRNILTLLETCTKEGPLLGLNFFISHDRPPRNTCWGLFYNTCEFLDKLCIFKGTRRDFLRGISGRVHISTRVKDSSFLPESWIFRFCEEYPFKRHQISNVQYIGNHDLCVLLLMTGLKEVRNDGHD